MVDSPEQTARWLRVPEAWRARLAMEPAIAAGIDSPHTLADRIRQERPMVPPLAWDSVRSAAQALPADFQTVVDLAAALSDADARGLHAEIASILTARPRVWGSALSIAWPGFTHQAELARTLILQGGHPGTSLLANALQACQTTTEAAAMLHALMRDEAQDVLAQLLQAGETGLARELAGLTSAVTSPSHSAPLHLTASAAAQSQGDFGAARQALLAGWDSAIEACAMHGDRMAEICLAEDDPVSAVEALKHALSHQPSRTRQARLAILLAKSGRAEEARAWTADSPESIEETVAKAVVALALGDAQHAAEAARRAAQECETIEALSPHWLEGLAEVLEATGQASAAARVVEHLARWRPLDAGLRMRMAELLLAAGQPDVAALQASAAAQLQPESTDARRIVARALRAAGKPEEALSHWVAIDSPHDDDRIETARCAIDAGQLDVATRVAETLARSKGASAVSLALLGRALMAAGRTVEARERLEAACAADPRDPEAWAALAECQAALGDPQAAGITLASAVQAAPGSGPVQHAYAVWLRGEGRVSEALEASARAARDPNADAAWLLEYGELLVELGHYDQATGTLRALLARRPADWPVRRALAQALLGSGQTAEAATLVGPLPAEADVEARAFAGHVLVSHAASAGDPHSARKAFELLAAVFNEQPSPEAQVNLARALEVTGQSEQALEHYRTGLEQRQALAPEADRLASLGLARCAIGLNRAPLAIHTLEVAAVRHGASADLQIALSAAYAAGGQHRRALESAQRASELAPDEASLRQLTLAAASAGESDLAKQAIQRLAALQPTSPHVWLTLAEVCGQSQDETQARAALARGLRLANSDAGAWSRASDLLQRFGRPESAQRALRKALYASPEDSGLVRKLAELSVETGDVATAQRGWMRYADLRSDQPEDLERAARALWLLGQRTVAVGLWQRAVVLAPQSLEAHRDLARAYLTEGDAPRALEHYRVVTQATGKDLGVALEAAAAELHYGSVTSAIELLEAASGNAPRDTHAWVALGEALLLAGRAPEARQALDTAYRLDPTDIPTLAGLAIAAQDTDDTAMAERVHTSALRRTCENAAAAGALARASMALGHWDQALAPIDRLNAAAPSLATLRAGVEIRLRLADAYWLHQCAASQRHGPSKEAVSQQALAAIHDLLTRLVDHAPAWEVERLRQRTAITFEGQSPASLQEAARRDPTGETLEGLALAWMRLERPSEALDLMDTGGRALAGRWLRLLTGMAQLATGELEAARSSFEAAGADATLRPLAEHLTAQTYLRQGDGEAYAEHASNALVEWSDEPAWHYELAQIYLPQGHTDAALPHLAEAVELSPENGEYALSLARTAAQAGDQAAALSGYRRVVESQPIDGQAWMEAGLCALAAGDAPKACEWLSRARTLLPGDIDCLVSSARASLLAGDARQAHEHIQAAYHLAPESADVLLVIGEIFARQGKFDRALQAFDRALKRTDDRLPIHIARGQLLVQIGRGGQAVDMLKAAVAQDPESAPGWAALAELQEAAGSLPEAVDAAARAVQFAPDAVTHRLVLGRLCRKTGQLDRALDELQRAQIAGHSDSRVSFELGRIYEERREFKRSLDAYQRVIDQEASHGEAHFRAGLVLKQIKAYPQAGKMLKRAVELNPKDPEALHQLAAVRALELVHGGITHQVVST